MVVEQCLLVAVAASGIDDCGGIIHEMCELEFG